MILSVIIPTRNRHLSLRHCVAAFASHARHAQEIEIIVVDDASSPEESQHNRAVCREYGAMYRSNALNSGPAASRNLGMACAQGQWFAFIDDDVCVLLDWCEKVLRELAVVAPGVVGLECAIAAAGEGLWDQEVENLTGGRYLTGHIIYKRDAIIAAGGFDENFKGPFCEDQELAARMLLAGPILFKPAIVAYHQPRRIHLGRYLVGSAGRIRMLLDSEFYFYRKHRDRYHQFRYAGTFWRTFLAVCTKNVITTLRRRRGQKFFARPRELLVLTAAAHIEQFVAPFLIFRYLRQWFYQPGAFFSVLIDRAASARLWGVPQNLSIDDLMLKVNPLKTLLYPSYRKASFSYLHSLKSLALRSARPGLKVFIRMDDMFLNQGYDYKNFIKIMSQNKISYLAAMTGNDLKQPSNWPLAASLQQAGGVVALHGFTHQGTFGPYQSEILQMSLPQLNAACSDVLESGLPAELRPSVFVPPFNAMGRHHMLALDKSFKVICGGPENLRFTGYCIGPVVLANGTVYFPSFQPFVCSGRKMVAKGVLRLLNKMHGIVCLNFHYIDEVTDNFAAFSRILEACSENIESWNGLLKGA